MDGHKINGTILALGQERIDPLPPIVADRGRAQLRPSRERLHQLVPELGGLPRGQVGLGAQLGLVKSEEVS